MDPILGPISYVNIEGFTMSLWARWIPEVVSTVYYPDKTDIFHSKHLENHKSILFLKMAALLPNIPVGQQEPSLLHTCVWSSFSKTENKNHLKPFFTCIGIIAVIYFFITFFFDNSFVSIKHWFSFYYWNIPEYVSLSCPRRWIRLQALKMVLCSPALLGGQ